MGYVLVNNKKPVRGSEVAANNSSNPKVIMGVKPRTEEEEKAMQEDMKKNYLACEEKRKKDAKKAYDIKNSGNSVSDADAKKLAASDDLEKENSTLKSKLTSFESEEKEKLQGKDKEIADLKTANEALLVEAEKQGGTNDGAGKPKRKK